MTRDRRRSPRVLTQSLSARVAGVDDVFHVLDVSFGGLRMMGRVQFESQLVHHVRVSGLVGGQEIELPARVVYSRPSVDGPLGEFETAFAFADLRQPATARGVQQIMDSVTSVFLVM